MVMVGIHIEERAPSRGRCCFYFKISVSYYLLFVLIVTCVVLIITVRFFTVIVTVALIFVIKVIITNITFAMCVILYCQYCR